jgi:hypothetical protein
LPPRAAPSWRALQSVGSGSPAVCTQKQRCRSGSGTYPSPCFANTIQLLATALFKCLGSLSTVHGYVQIPVDAFLTFFSCLIVFRYFLKSEKSKHLDVCR